MQKNIIILNASIINEGSMFNGSIHVQDGIINEIYTTNPSESLLNNSNIIDASGKILIPGVIDDQVHFREPGLTHKGDIYSESKAAVAGGITSYMEMPNTKPQTVTQELLEEKYQLAARRSLANYSFYFGATNDNADEINKTNAKNVCGVKVFMGSSTGNMLVDNIDSLSKIFAESPVLIATHCEDEEIIKRNIKNYTETYGDQVLIQHHPLIRSGEACFKSTSLAIELARKYHSRLHVLHLSTAKELQLFDNKEPSIQKRITGEVCVHHLWFDDSDYDKFGNRIKWNPAIKQAKDKEALFEAVLSNKIDVIATDHAPHTIDEKSKIYMEAPSGGPLVQHSLVAMLDFYHSGKIPLEKIVEKMCHTPADIFGVSKRGYIRKGYYADFVLLDLKNKWEVTKDNILYKCKWSPFEGHEFKSKITHTFVNGHLVYEEGKFNEEIKGMRLEFDR